MSEDLIIKGIEDEQESALNKSNNVAIFKATQIEVTDNETYSEAATFLKEIKTAQAAVTDTFKEMKEAAHKAHKTVCDKENQFLKPLKEAETIVKNKARIYIDICEQKKREEEAKLRAEQQRIAEEQMAKALELEKQGKEEQAKAAYDTVTAIENLEPTITQEKPQVSGISTQVAYEVVVTDETLVPAYVNGAEIRQINLSAIKQLAKATKGAIQIPGIKINKTNSISVR